VAFFIYTNRPITVQVALVEDYIVVRIFGLRKVEARVLSKIGSKLVPRWLISMLTMAIL